MVNIYTHTHTHTHTHPPPPPHPPKKKKKKKKNSLSFSCSLTVSLSLLILLLCKTLQQKFLIAYNLPSSFLPSLSFLRLPSLSLCLSFCLFLDLYNMSLFWTASGLISSAVLQLDRDSFPVPFYSLLTSLYILTLS